MDVNVLLPVLMKGAGYTNNQKLIEAAEGIAQEFSSINDKQQIYAHICTLQELLLKNALKKRLYVQQKRNGTLSHPKAQEKEKFLKGKRPMTLPELTQEFESIFQVLLKVPKPVFQPLTADISLFRDAHDEKNVKYPWVVLQQMLQESIRFLLEFVCEGKVENEPLEAFLSDELSFDRLTQDIQDSLDYHSSTSIVQTLTHAIHAYHDYELFQSVYDTVPAAQRLKQATVSAFECCEFAYMHYIYMRTKDLVQMRLEPVTALNVVEKFRKNSNARSFMDIQDKRTAFEDLHERFVKDHGTPAHQVKLDLIQEGWPLYIRAKHYNEAPRSADALHNYMQEIVRLVKFAVLNEETTQELEKFLQEDQQTTVEVESVTQFSDPAWEDFFEMCNRFESGYHYVLVAPENLDSPYLNSLFRIPWDMIIDFNPATENGGLMDIYRTEMEKPPNSRDLGKVIDPFMTIAEPYWIRANGVYDSRESICTTHVEWKKRYGKYIPAMLQAFHSVYTGFLKFIYLPGHSPKTLEYLIERIDEVFADDMGKRIPDYEHILMDNHHLVDDYDGDAVLCANITVEQMLQGCAHSGTERYQLMSHHLPGMEPDAQVRKEYALEDFCEPLYDSVGTDSADSCDDVRDFYRGARKISWRELSLRKDLQRDDYYSTLIPQLRKIMQESEQALFPIMYSPGLGGTTVLRRIAWDMHKEYPTLIIHRYFQGCDKRLQALRRQIVDGRRMLLLIDSNDISYQDAFALFRALKSQNSRFVMIYLYRRGNAMDVGEGKFFVIKELDPMTEVPQMIEKLQGMDLEPSCNLKLKGIRDRGIARKEDRTPFFLSMCAFDKEFVGFQNYVAHFLKEPMQEKYRNFLVYIALRDLVTSGPALDVEFFKYHMDGVRTREEAQNELCRHTAFKDLVVFQKEKKLLTCRYRYYGIAHAMLCQLTNNNPEADCINYIRLASYVTEFIKETCIRGRNENLVDFLKRLLIDRDEIFLNKESQQNLDGNNPNARTYEEREKFSPLIMQIGCEGKNNRQWTPSGRIAVSMVFSTLAECYPDNPHFIAHYARFLSEMDGNRTKALEILNRALNMGGDNYDNTLLHMKGMVYRRLAEGTIDEIRTRKNQHRDYSEQMEILRLQVEEAQAVFSNFEKRGIRGVAGLLSDCKLCISVIEMGMGLEQLDADLFLLNHTGSDDWYHNLADRAASLFESCEKYREEIYGEDLKNYFSVQQSIHRLENGSRNSIQYYEENLKELDRIYRPIMRRHLVRAYLDGISYTATTEKDKQAYWHRIRQLMEDNILEDPNNPTNYRQWFRAAINTHDENADQLMLNALKMVNDWLAIDESGPDVQMYRYILNFLQAVDGSTQAEQNMEYYRREMQKYCNTFTEKTSTRYWLGPGRGLQRLVVLSGEDIRKTEEVHRRLRPLNGRLHKYRNERNASIKSYNAEVFFMPQQSDILEDHFDSRLEVIFYLGFSYDGPRAHNATVELKTGQKMVEDELRTGDIVESTVLEQRKDYLILDIRNFDQKAKLYFVDLLEPYSEANLPAVMTDLNIELIHVAEIRDNDGVQVGWLAKMYQDDE